MTEPLRLYTFSISHFSEKIRWTLGLENIAFEEVAWAPPFHVVDARRSGSATTVPVLEAGGRRVQDSTHILHWLDTNRGPLSLLPKDDDARREALAIEERFDRIGSDVIRIAYDHVLPDAEAVVRLWTIDATPLQARVLRAVFPAFRVLFRRRIEATPARVAESRARIEEGLALVEERLAAGHRHLVGDRLTIADVTAASLLAPLACPAEHPVYASATYRAGVAALVAPWSKRPALDWVRELYREHRGSWPRAAHVRARLQPSE
jgi:glutathione S-transferase